MLAFVILLILDKTSFKRTPERVLKATFGISLKDLDYSVETFEEQWLSNGDGYTFVVFRFNKLTQENIDYLKSFGLKPLPFSEKVRSLLNFSEISIKHFKVDIGYYLHIPLHSIDVRDYKIFIIDTENKIAILYYQIM